MRTMTKVLVLGTALLAVAALAAEISIDADRTADFSAYKTYAWKGGTPAADAAVNAAVVEDIDELLAARGLQKTDATPDLYVHYHVKQHDDVKVTDWDEGKFKLENRNITEKWSKVGTLVIDLVDAKTGSIVWRAAATDSLKSSVLSQEFLDGLKRTIATMLGQYPPKKR
jgi:hypothetical protein